MQIDLSGRTALVTGSSQGIGAAIAAGLAAAGARVGVNGRSAASVSRAVAELRERLPGAELVEVVVARGWGRVLMSKTANMVTYLASPLASATTGGALRVDGGYVDGILP